MSERRMEADCSAHPRRYTDRMKTAVSIPDDVFEKAERYARRVKKTRSEVYSAAVGEYVARHSPEEITKTINAVLEAAGGPLKDVTFNQIFLSDMGGYAAMNEVYRGYFRENPPARYCVRADLVRPEFLVEIASIAHLER